MSRASPSSAGPVAEAVDAGLRILRQSPGRVVAILHDGSIFGCRGYRLYRSNDDGRTWSYLTRMPAAFSRAIAGWSRLASRLLRVEVRALGVLSDRTLIAANREGIYRAAPDEPVMSPCVVERGPHPLAPPMTITIGPGDRILCGEYDSRTAHGRPVRLLVSDDRGRTFQVARVFEGGSILHVHNLVFDARLRSYWLLAGDHNHEPGIGLLSEDLKTFDWIAKGEQKYRAVEVFDFGDRLIYGIDSEKEANAIVSFDKSSGRVDRIVEIEGSCIYACRFGGLYVLSTTVEPSVVNTSRSAGLWVSRKGDHWTRVFQAPKDVWNARYFQYGSLVLPRGASDQETIFFSGQALSRIDGRIVTAAITPDAVPAGMGMV